MAGAEVEACRLPLELYAALVSVEKLDSDQLRQLSVLRRALVLGEEIIDSNLERARLLQEVGEWVVVLLVSPGVTESSWRLLDPFSVESRQQYRMSVDRVGTQEFMAVTAYDIIDSELLGRVLNTNLTEVVRSYEAIAEMPSTYQLANERMLALLKAADAIPERTAEHLQAAAAINGWLIESEGEQPVHLVNKWQIEWRDGGLSESRRAEIRKFKRSLTITAPSMTAELGLACALLLGDDHEIASIVDELDERQRASMESWPIWHLNQHSN